MPRYRDIVTVYAAGVVQGVALVTFPAASAIFTAANGYNLSATEYGGMFVPQAILAIGASLFGAGLMRRIGIKQVYLIGLAANILAMALLLLSTTVEHQHPSNYTILLCATACLGAGFGFTVPALNTLAALFFSGHVDRAVLGMNAGLGLGTALAPVFVALFAGLGLWWGLPVLVGVVMLSLLLCSALLPLVDGKPGHAAQAPAVGRAGIPIRFWIFSGFALLYGVCETMNGTWASLYMNTHFTASPAIAALALTMFWGMVTVGRILFAAIERWLPEQHVCRILPVIVASAFVLTATLPRSLPALGVMAFALAGLGCSALLPLSISFAQKEFASMQATAAGSLIAFYQVGYGIAAFGVGPLQSTSGLPLDIIYGGATVLALALSVLSFLIVRSRNPPSPRQGAPNRIS